MKVSVLSISLLAAASSAFAAPASTKRATDLRPLAIIGLTGSTYSQTPPTTQTIDLTIQDPNTGKPSTTISIDCSAAWSEGQAGSMKFPCKNKAYSISFPEGIYNLEDFKIEIDRESGAGTQTATAHVAGVDWGCKKQDGYPEETCGWVGALQAPFV